MALLRLLCTSEKFFHFMSCRNTSKKCILYPFIGHSRTSPLRRRSWCWDSVSSPDQTAWGAFPSAPAKNTELINIHNSLYAKVSS
ncbi:UNVERIFIED_CONTAM: hypothetical protein Sradi_0256600 [Sesamum radiatum]|uniref:Uncharacterized protein n=1 Tax=Sesamum radiatum TaxID=300843 RepID=A0AAW2W1L4_SESRA